MTDTRDDNEQVVPVFKEELVGSKRAVKTGSVRVQKHVETHVEKVSMPLIRETVEIRRVPMNRVVDTMPEARTVGDTTVIPVVEEELVVTKRLILREEVHMTKTRTRQNETQDVTVGKERAEVTRMDAEGRVTEEKRKDSVLNIGDHPSILGR